MSAATAIAVSVAFFSVFGGAFITAVYFNETERQIAVACVSNGGEWKKPSWSEPQSCIR